MKKIALEYVSTTKELEHVQWYLSYAQQLNAMFECSQKHTTESCTEATSHMESMLESLVHFSTTDIIDDAYPFISDTFYRIQSDGLPSRKPPHIPISEVISITIMQLSLTRDCVKFLLSRPDLLSILRLLPALSLRPLSPCLRSVVYTGFLGAFPSGLQLLQSLTAAARLSDKVLNTIKITEPLENSGNVAFRWSCDR